MTDYTGLIDAMGSPAPSPVSAVPQSLVVTPDPGGPAREDGTKDPIVDEGSSSATPAAPGADSGYAAVIRAMDAARQTQAQAALYQARDANPDNAARAQSLAAQFEVPSAAVEADLPTWEQRAALLKSNQALRENPQLSDWLIANPEAARVARDDYDNLSFVGRAASAFSQGWAQSAAGNQAGREAFAGNLDAAAAIQKSLADAPIPGGPVGYTARLVGGLLGGFADMASHSTTEAATGAALGGVLGSTALGVGAGPGAAAGFGAGMTAGVLADAFKVGYGSLKSRLSAVTDAAGNKLDPTMVEGASLAGGLVNGWLNAMGLRFGLRPSAEVTGLISDSIEAAVSRPSVRQALLSYGGNLIKAGGVGGALGLAMEASNIASEQAAKLLSPGDFQTVFDSPAEREAAVQRLAQSAADMATGMGVLHALPGGFGLGRDILAARRAASDVAMFQNLEGAVSTSKVRDRATSLFQDWVSRQTEGTPVENLFVPAARIAEMYQSAGIEPGADDPLFGRVAPDIAAQLEQGRLTGGDVVLPAAAYLTHLAGTPVSEALRPDIRVRQDGMSLNEAQAFNEHYREAMEQGRAELDAADEASEAVRSSVQKVFDDILSQSRFAGFTADAARQYAALFAARYAARGERMGQDPWDLYRDEGVSIQQDLPESLRGRSADALDVLINALKTTRGLPSDRKVFGPSLLEYIARRGGAYDTDGELAAMDAHTWHRGRVGMPRLIRPDEEVKGAAIPGMHMPGASGAHAGSEHTLENTAVAAWEEGYFPELGEERPEASHLLEAVREELAGNPRYAERNLNQQALEFRGAVDDLDRHLGNMGIDPKKTSAADIRAAIEKAQAEGEGREFGQAALAKSETIEGETDWGHQYAVDVNPRPARLKQLLEQSGGSVRVVVGGSDVAVADAGKAIHSYIEQALMDEDHPMLGDMDPEGAERLGLVLHGEKGDPVPDTVRLGDWNVYLERPRTEGLDPDLPPQEQVDRVPLSEWPEGLRRAVGLKREFNQPAYHGSPHIFDKFTLDHIGTGEGAQAFGHGLYFASNKAVARFYREATSARTATFRGKPIAEVEEGDSSSDHNFVRYQFHGFASLQDAIDSQRGQIARYNEEGDHAYVRALEADLERMERLLPEIKRSEGRLYHVDIPEDHEYLDWDKRLSEQSPEVQAALKKAGLTEPTVRVLKRDDGTWAVDFVDEGERRRTAGRVFATEAQAHAFAGHLGPDPTGREILQARLPKADPAATSRALLEAGIPGIRYLDGNSRGAGEGSHNYVLFDDNRVSIQGYEQRQAAAAGAPASTLRGSIRLGEGQAIISLFKARNLSTLLHEAGHLFLDELVRDAADPSAPQSVRDDLAETLKWLGVSSADQIETVHHEQWARGFEAYLMEGEAPAVALRPVFARLKAWLTNIYRTISGLNVAVSPEMRAVFDRLLATDDEIARAQQSQTPPLFKSAGEAGMSDAEFAAYTASVARSREVAESALLKKVMATIRRQREAAWRAEAAPLTEQIAAEVGKQPVYQALNMLRAGGYQVDLEGGPVLMKLNKDVVARMLGTETALDMMPAGTLSAEGGVHPDTVAEASGFRSGEEMVRALAGVEAKRKELRARGDERSPQTYDVEEMVRSEMEARHGDPLHDGSIEREALDAIHNDRAMQTIATELRALGRRPQTVDAGPWRGRAAVGDVTPLEVVKRWAARAIGDKPVWEATRTGAYARAEAKAAGAAEAAILAGDREGAWRAKQQQLMNHALYVESLQASEMVDAAVKVLDRYAGLRSTKTMDQNHLDQIHDLIARFDFGRSSQVAVDRRQRLAAWVDAQRAQGYSPPIPEALLDEAYSTHYSRMKLDDFRGLMDAVESIAHIGRLKQKLRDAQEERSFQAVVAEMVATAGKLPQLEPDAVRNPAARGSGLAEFTRQAGAAVKHVLKSADASLLKMDQMFQWLDGRNPNGVFQRVIMRRLSEAQTREHDLQAEYTAKLRRLGEELPGASRRALSQRLTISELSDSVTNGPTSMLKSELIAMALNIGNASNLDKLVRGEKWSEASIRAALDAHMTADDWHFVQGVWDTIEGLWPQIADLERRLNGVAPEKVEALEVRTPYGMLRGGYYPVVYDPLRSYMAEKNSPSDALFQNAYTRAATAQGHTETRTDAAAPLYLSLDVLPRHLQQVIHDLAWREAVMDVDRITANPKVREAIDNAMGREYRQQIRPWLQSIANDKAYDPRGLAFWDKVAHWARTNATVVGLGFRLSTMLVHGTSAALNSVGEVGTRPMLDAVATFIKDPAGSRDFVFAKSGEMRNRLNEVDRDMREAMGGELLGNSGPLATVRRASMMGVAMLDMASALPTWLAAYQTALKGGAAEAEAVAAADVSVRNAHGAGAAKDHSAIQRGSEFQKLFTMFYSFWNHLYNRQRDLARQAGEVRSVKDFGAVLGRSFFYLIAPPLIHGLISGGASGPGDDESWGAWAAEHIVLGLAGGVPILRDLVSAAENHRDYAVTPAAGGVAKVATSGKDLGKALDMIEGEPSERWLQHAGSAAGYVFGLPLGQASGSAQYLWDVWRGEEDPAGVADFLRGLMYGPTPKKQQ